MSHNQKLAELGAKNSLVPWQHSKNILTPDIDKQYKSKTCGGKYF
jgi:hypothetical protein